MIDRHVVWNHLRCAEAIYSIKERPMGVGTPQVGVLKLGPLLSSPVPSGPFACIDLDY